MKDKVWTFIAAIFYIAIIYILVRPQSNGPTLINNIFTAFSDLVRGSIGYSWDQNANNGKGGWIAP